LRTSPWTAPQLVNIITDLALWEGVWACFM
jgi:hypothetical protein